MKRHAALACLAFVWLASAPVFAQDASSEAEQRRTQLFKEGRALGDAGKWSEAVVKFREVVVIRSAPKALVALAIAEERLGHLAEAKRLYEKARFDARLAELKDDEETAVQALRQLAPRVPGVSLRLPSDVRGVSVTVDGKAAELVGGEVDLDPGERALVVSAPGRVDFQTTVNASEGKRPELEVALPLSSGSNSRSNQGDNGVDGAGGGITPPPLGAIIVGGAGVIMGITGIALIGVGKGAERDAMDMCGGVNNCPLSLKPAVDAAATKIIAGDVMLGLGAAAILGGGAWWFLSRGKSDPAKGGAGQARVTVAPLRSGVWLSVHADF